jgi:hypothetical protein
MPPTAVPVMASAIDTPVYSGVPTSLPALSAWTMMIAYNGYDIM